jgi:hypothetical protein
MGFFDSAQAANLPGLLLCKACERRRQRQSQGKRMRVPVKSQPLRNCRFPIALIGVCVLGLVGVACSAQQNPTDAPSTTSPPQSSAPPEGKLAIVELVSTKSRVFPDLAYNSARLTSWQKFQLATNNSVSLSTFGVAIVSAGWGQALDHPAGYGEGGEAFGKRFGANMARSASDNMFGTFLVASAFHEDPRFYVRHNLTFAQKLKYGAVRVVFTRSDSGARTVNLAGLLGPLASEAVANTYFPEPDRTFERTMARYASDIAWKFAGNVGREYWPVINRKLRIMPAATNRQQ